MIRKISRQMLAFMLPVITFGFMVPKLAAAGQAANKAASAKAASANTATPKDASSDRGAYIVENVAVCSQCHSPHDTPSHADRSHWLQGASVWLQSAIPVQDWPQQAPRIAGALPSTDDEMITLLTTGIWPKTGTYLRPPMPQFRLSRQDAEAVVAYLKSLKPGSN